MYERFFLMACLLSLFGCRQAFNKEIFKNTEYAQDDPSMMRIKIEDIDPGSVLKYSDVLEYVSFVRLETTDNSLIGRVDKVIATDDKFIIMDSSIARMIFVFNRDGSFSNRIGTQGGGPEDYDHPGDIAYDKYDDELLVLCQNRSAILRFKLDGTFAGKTTFDWLVNSIFVTGKNACLVYFNNYIQPNNKKNEYNMVIINKNGDILETLLPYNEEIGKLSPSRPVFSYYNDEIIFALRYFNTVYKLDNNEIKPKYFLDFGKRKTPASVYGNKNDKELEKVLRDNNYPYVIASFETSSHVICQLVYDKGSVFECFFSKESGNIRITSAYFNDMYALASAQPSSYLKGDSLINCIPLELFISFNKIITDTKDNKISINDALYNNLSSLSSPLINKDLKENYLKIFKSAPITLTYEEVELINNIDEMDNPILMISKLKRF